MDKGAFFRLTVTRCGVIRGHQQRRDDMTELTITNRTATRVTYTYIDRGRTVRTTCGYKALQRWLDVGSAVIVADLTAA
jgi:hypothetical protein